MAFVVYMISVIIAVSATVALSIVRANKREAEYQEYIKQREAKYQEYIKKKVHDLVNKTKVTPEEFFELRNLTVGKNKNSVSKTHNFPGVYVIYNQTKDMYYVGQGVRVFDRVNNHFTGKGNGDVYADYKYNNYFQIGIIPFENCGFSTLNELERVTIKTYNAYIKGYNKTRGNQG